RPKAMLPVLGKPLVIRLMDRMHDAGIHHFIVVVGEDDGSLASYLGNSWVPDAKISIVLQTAQRGPAQVLASASSYLTGSFLLTSCDHLTPPEHITNLIKRFQNTNADITLSVAASTSADNLPGVETEGDRITAISPASPQAYHPQSAFLL